MKRAGEITLYSETDVTPLKRQCVAANSNGFVLVSSALNGMCRDFLKYNTNKLQPCEIFLEETKFELYNLLCKIVRVVPIKFNLRLHVTYKNRFLDERVEAGKKKKFQTSACKMIVANNPVIDAEFQKLLLKKEKYEDGIFKFFSEVTIDSFLVSVVTDISFGHFPLM